MTCAANKQSHFDTVPAGYTPVSWPQSQECADAHWFDEHAILITGGKLYEQLGDMAYLVPTEFVKSPGAVS
jgi:hypothetical protein